MSGPSARRENLNAAPIPGLTGGLEQLFKQMLKGGQTPQLSSPLQQQSTNAFSQLLGMPTAQQTALKNAQGSILSQLQGDPGADILSAAQPLFQRNLGDAAAILRQSGPRFASNTERLVSEQGQRSLQDFNLFAQQVMESGRQRQLQAASALGGLAGGADASQLANLGGATNFLGMQQGGILQLLQLLSQLGAGPAVITQNPGSRPDIMGAIGGGLGMLPFLIGGMGGGGGNG